MRPRKGADICKLSDFWTCGCRYNLLRWPKWMYIAARRHVRHCILCWGWCFFFPNKQLLHLSRCVVIQTSTNLSVWGMQWVKRSRTISITSTFTKPHQSTIKRMGCVYYLTFSVVTERGFINRSSVASFKVLCKNYHWISVICMKVKFFLYYAHTHMYI